MNTETRAMSDKELKRQEKAASRRLAELAAAGDPGRGLALTQAQPLRDERIQALRTAKAETQAARAELARRETEKQSLWERMFASEAANKRRKENAPTAFEAERVAFLAELKAEQDAKNAAELQRRRDLGLVYEPTGEGGGDACAALFSSSVLWAFSERKIQKDGVVGVILTARHVLTLWWVANLIAEHGGEAATFAARTAPHWPDDDGEIPFREADIAHLERNGFIEVERQLGAGGSVTYRYGSRTKALVTSYRESIGRKAA